MIRMIDNQLLAVILGSVISAMGFLQDSSAVVIGSMMISPIGSIAINGVRERSLRKLWISIAVPIITGFVVSFLHSKLLQTRLNLTQQQQQTREGPKFTSQLLARTGSITSIIAYNSVIAFASGILIKKFRADEVVLAGVGVATSILPPLVAGGMFLQDFMSTRDPGSIQKSFQALLIFTINIVCILVGYWAGRFL